MNAQEDPLGSRLQDPAFASALEGYLAILVRRANAVRPVDRRVVILPPEERAPAERQKTAS